MQNNIINLIIHQAEQLQLSAERLEIIHALSTAIIKKIKQNEAVNINFICTHNSRRSHLSQIWAQTFANHFKLPQINCYSGGTEATQLFPMIADTLSKQGFSIHILAEGLNPIYAVKFDVNDKPIIGFSKTYQHPFNPQQHFIAVMTCHQATEACPVVFGASDRISMWFEDPKVFDGTPEAAQKYEERSIEIARELYLVFKEVNAGINA